MPEEQATPAPAPPAPPAAAAPAPAPDVQRQLGALADAVKQLAESQTTLLQVLGKQAGGAAGSPAAPAPAPPPPDIGGDVGEGGVRPSVVVDYSKLTPLQQIAVGLRDAKPQGPGVLRRSMTTRDDVAPAANGAD